MVNPPQCCPVSRKKYTDTYIALGKISGSFDSLWARSLLEDSPRTLIHPWTGFMSRRHVHSWEAYWNRQDILSHMPKTTLDTCLWSKGPTIMLLILTQRSGRPNRTFYPTISVSSYPRSTAQGIPLQQPMWYALNMMMDCVIHLLPLRGYSGQRTACTKRLSSSLKENKVQVHPGPLHITILECGESFMSWSKPVVLPSIRPVCFSLSG